MIKILFCIPTLSGGGAERVLTNLVNHLDNKKYDITVCTLFNSGKYKDELASNINYKYIFKKPFKGNSRIFQLFPPKFLFKRFIKEHYDIIVSYLESPFMRIVSGCDDRSTKLISWTHSEMIDGNELLTCFRNKDERLNCYLAFDKNIFVSKTVMDSTLKYIPLKNCQVLYNIVESDVIVEKSKEKIDDFTFDKNKINLISVGRFVNAKGYPRLLNIVKRLKDDGFDISLTLLGDGEEKSKLEKIILENELSDDVSLIGFKENPYKYVKGADLFVCSSLIEGFSTAVSESLIVGTPVITTRCSGMDEILGHGKYGIITDNDEKSLYILNINILSDDGELERLKDLAIVRGKYFDMNKNLEETEKMFDSVLENTNAE
jgi:glycosyltransferase involved in cell wall biosynthesis